MQGGERRIVQLHSKTEFHILVRRPIACDVLFHHDQRGVQPEDTVAGHLAAAQVGIAVINKAVEVGIRRPGAEGLGGAAVIVAGATCGGIDADVRPARQVLGIDDLDDIGFVVVQPVP